MPLSYARDYQRGASIYSGYFLPDRPSKLHDCQCATRKIGLPSCVSPPVLNWEASRESGDRPRYIQDWVVAALNTHAGSASIVQVAEHIWAHHENELRGSGELFYTWQYDMRWACTRLRKRKLSNQLRFQSAGSGALQPDNSFKPMPLRGTAYFERWAS